MKTEEDLIRLFLFDGPPCLISYEYRKKRSGIVFKEDWPLLKKLINEGLVWKVQKTSRFIKFGYRFWNIIIGKHLIMVFDGHGGDMKVKITDIIPDMSGWPILKFKTEKHGMCLLDAHIICQFHKSKEVPNNWGSKYILLDPD